jgi:hypothetical protein
MATTYGEFGIKTQSSVASGTDVSSITVDLPNTTGISFVTGVLSAATEVNNYQFRVLFYDSSQFAIRTRFRLMTNSTTNTFWSSGTTGFFPINYWNIGAANSDASYTGERANFFMIIDNNLSNSSPIVSPHILTVTCNSNSNGYTDLHHLRGVAEVNKNIAKVRFISQVGNLSAYRIRVFSVFES